ncbi:VWA domain-containing protein [Marinobacter salicampi]|uniref:VWA domain-containing protein n=1 Tax=Marinobacter salicampi TaxID=435907 RepID=UPI001407EE21|nr:VWA domain-containing protein [Marinobacter salicampi]
MDDLHFLRPLWLLLLLAIPLLPAAARQVKQHQSGWARIIPAALLKPLIRSGGTTSSPSRFSAAPLMAAWLILCLALAGPAWREAPTPLQQQNDSLVIVLNLSLSMLATDVEPDRLTLAKRKIRDLLGEREGSLTGLVVYAGDAHVVTPLTDDRQTIEGLLGVLDPIMMPATGNRADLAIARARELLERGARGKGRILLITDDIQASHRYAIRDELEGSPYPLYALVVGTRSGGPIPLPKQGFVRDNGDIVVVQADPEALAELTSRTGGSSHSLTVDNTDINSLDLLAGNASGWEETEQDLTVSRWQDDGYWLLWLALPLLLLSWRKGALMATVLVVAPTVPSPALALEWADLWQRPDQRGQALIEQDPERAAKKFDDPSWRGSALYRAEDYDAAAEAFEQAPGADAHYNRGIALTRAGKLEEAKEAFEEALAADPNHEDARHNAEIVEELLEQQQQEQQDGEGESEDQDQDSQNQDGEQQGDKEGDQRGDQQSDQDSDASESPDSGQQDQGGQSSDQQQDSQADDQQPGAQNEGDGDDQEQPQPAQPRQLDGTPEPGTDQNAEAAEEQGPQLDQGQEQWLRRIPDDPGGLLRRKFQQQYRERATQPDESDTPW